VSPNFDYFLTDLQTLNDEQILELNKGLLINTLLLMKHIWEPEFVLKNPDLIFVHLEDNQYSDFQIPILAYFFKKTDIASEKVQTFIKALPTSINKNAMSTYDMIVEEGIAKGREEGRKEGREEGRKEMRQKITRQMLLKGFDYNFIIEILHVEREFIDTVKEALLLEQEGPTPTPPVP
jgi:flagellar biosynthesis/type III secretory pathway protein FliH